MGEVENKKLKNTLQFAGWEGIISGRIRPFGTKNQKGGGFWFLISNLLGFRFFLFLYL